MLIPWFLPLCFFWHGPAQQGLTAAEVQNRVAIYGPNSLKEPDRQVRAVRRQLGSQLFSEWGENCPLLRVPFSSHPFFPVRLLSHSRC